MGSATAVSLSSSRVMVSLRGRSILDPRRALEYYILDAGPRIRNAIREAWRGTMSDMSPGAALRQLQQAQAGLKKARQALRLAKGDPQASRGVLKVGWESLAQAH